MNAKTFLISLLSLFLLVTACSRIYGPVKELDALNAAKDQVLMQWAKIIDKEASEASIAEARKVFEDNRSNLNAKRDALAAAPRGMNSDWMTRWMDSKIADQKTISAMSLKFSDYEVAQKFRKLGDEFIEASYGKSQ